MGMNIINFVKQQSIEWKFSKSLVAARRMRKIIADAYPSMLLKLNSRKGDALLYEFRQCSTVSDCVEFTKQNMGTGSCQIPWEIESAITLMASVRPHVICEIGTFQGGTTLLFSRFLSMVKVILCIDLYVKNKQVLKLLAPPGQHFEFFDMPSYSERTVARVAEFLNGRMIDALFIDGDHRYQGVKQDFLCYRSFVKEGGLILFHDIVEEDGCGKAWAGGVPKLWRELSPYYPHREFVQSQDQAGFGIGALTYSRAAQPPIVMQASHASSV
jgi:cephalosporin hydroxylase